MKNFALKRMLLIKANMKEDRFVRMKELTTIVGVGKSTIYRLISANKFPPQVKITQRTSGWRLSAVMEWMERREEATK